MHWYFGEIEVICVRDQTCQTSNWNCLLCENRKSYRSKVPPDRLHNPPNLESILRVKWSYQAPWLGRVVNTIFNSFDFNPLSLRYPFCSGERFATSLRKFETEHEHRSKPKELILHRATCSYQLTSWSGQRPDCRCRMTARSTERTSAAKPWGLNAIYNKVEHFILFYSNSNLKSHSVHPLLNEFSTV